MIIKEVFNKWFDFKMVRIFLCEVKITSEDHMEGRAHGPRAPLHFISFKIACMHALLENQTIQSQVKRRKKRYPELFLWSMSIYMESSFFDAHQFIPGDVPLMRVGSQWRSSVDYGRSTLEEFPYWAYVSPSQMKKKMIPKAVHLMHVDLYS